MPKISHSVDNDSYNTSPHYCFIAVLFIVLVLLEEKLLPATWLDDHNYIILQKDVAYCFDQIETLTDHAIVITIENTVSCHSFQKEHKSCYQFLVGRI